MKDAAISFLVCLFIVFFYTIKILSQGNNDIPELTSKLYNLFQQNKYVEAIPIAQQLVQICEQTRGPEHLETADALIALSACYISINNFSMAEPLYERVLRIYEKAFGPEDPKTANLLNNIATFYTNSIRAVACG